MFQRDLFQNRVVENGTSILKKTGLINALLMEQAGMFVQPNIP
jgi:hypothetical protein